MGNKKYPSENEYSDYLAKNGCEYEESTKNQATKEQQELLLKMLAVSKINTGGESFL